MPPCTFKLNVINDLLKLVMLKNESENSLTFFSLFSKPPSHRLLLIKKDFSNRSVREDSSVCDYLLSGIVILLCLIFGSLPILWTHDLWLLMMGMRKVIIQSSFIIHADCIPEHLYLKLQFTFLTVSLCRSANNHEIPTAIWLIDFIHSFIFRNYVILVMVAMP